MPQEAAQRPAVQRLAVREEAERAARARQVAEPQHPRAALAALRSLALQSVAQRVAFAP